MKLTNKLVLFVILLAILISPVVAQSYYKQATDVDLKVPCINNYTYCSGAAMCNLTIFYPNASVLINNQPMTNQGTYFNYTINSTQTEATGNYTANMFCNDSGTMGYSIFDYQITWNGNPLPGDGMRIFMILAFIALTIALIYTTFNFFKEMMIFNTDVMDVAKSLVVFCVIIAMYYFNTAYMADAYFDQFAKWFIELGSITNVLLPFIGFAVTFMYRRTQWRKFGDDGGPG